MRNKRKRPMNALRRLARSTGTGRQLVEFFGEPVGEFIGFLSESIACLKQFIFHLLARRHVHIPCQAHRLESPDEVIREINFPPLHAVARRTGECMMSRATHQQLVARSLLAKFLYPHIWEAEFTNQVM